MPNSNKHNTYIKKIKYFWAKTSETHKCGRWQSCAPGTRGPAAGVRGASTAFPRAGQQQHRNARYGVSDPATQMLGVFSRAISIIQEINKIVRIRAFTILFIVKNLETT